MAKMNSLIIAKGESISIKNYTLNFIKKIKQFARYYFTFFLIIILLIIGDFLILHLLELNIISFTNLIPIFTTLISINISLFALSIIFMLSY